MPPSSVADKSTYPPIPLLHDELTTTGVFPVVENNS